MERLADAGDNDRFNNSSQGRFLRTFYVLCNGNTFKRTICFWMWVHISQMLSFLHCCGKFTKGHHIQSFFSPPSPLVSLSHRITCLAQQKWAKAQCTSAPPGLVPSLAKSASSPLTLHQQAPTFHRVYAGGWKQWQFILSQSHPLGPFHPVGSVCLWCRREASPRVLNPWPHPLLCCRY